MDLFLFYSLELRRFMNFVLFFLLGFVNLSIFSCYFVFHLVEPRDFTEFQSFIPKLPVKGAKDFGKQGRGRREGGKEGRRE